MEIEDYDSAFLDYTKVIELEPNEPRNYSDRADCYIEMEDFTNALKDLDKAVIIV